MIKIGMPQLYEYDTIEENLILAKNLGVDFIELNLNFGYCRAEMERKSLAELLKKYGIEATLHFYDEADFGSYDEVCEAYLTLLSKYARLASGYVKIINVHLISGPVVTISGVKNYIYEKEFDEYIKRLISNLRKAEKICNENGMEMVLENTDYLAAFMKKTYLALSEAGFKFNYDIGHDRCSGDFLLNEVIDEAGLSFKEMHIHDSDGKKCHLSIGEGDTDLKKYERFMKDNYLLLEVKQKSDLLTSVPKFKKIFS